MNLLKIHLFGNIRVNHTQWTTDVKITKRVKAILAYLLIYRNRFHHRNILADLFWCDFPEERARCCLSTALWRLRGVLEPGNTTKGTYLITTTGGEVGFNIESNHWLDVAFFEKKTRGLLTKPVQEMKPEDADQLEDALRLYTGELMEGFYDEWALRERERLRSLYLKCLAHMMRYKGCHMDYEHAIACGKHILVLDPLREDIHREVMRLHAKSGHRTQAIRHYEDCCRVLDKELGVNPMEETRGLYEAILNPSDKNMPRGPLGQTGENILSKERYSLDQAVQKLSLVMKDFEKMQKKIMQIVQLLDQNRKCMNKS